MTTVIYCGERVGLFGRIHQLFKDKKGKEYSYTGIKDAMVGYCYEVSAKDQMSLRPKTVEGFPMSEKDKLEMEAQKLAVRAERLMKRKAFELKRPHPDIVRALKLLAPFYRGLTRFDQDRFMSYLGNEMSRKPKRRR